MRSVNLLDDGTNEAELSTTHVYMCVMLKEGWLVLDYIPPALSTQRFRTYKV